MRHTSRLFLVVALIAAGLTPAFAQSGDRAAKMQERLKAADTNGDGLIDRSEAEAGLPRVAEHFDKLDADGDGKLSRDELQKMREQMRQRRGG
jgi:Ca2+-binding EF-hand superfamily protein